MPDQREQAEAVARWCGWLWDQNRCEVCGWPFDDQRGGVPFHCSERPVPAIRAIDRMLPNFAASLDAMREVEDEIERRGLVPQFCAELWKLEENRPETEFGYGGFIALGLTATAEQRLAALMRVLDRLEGGKDVG